MKATKIKEKIAEQSLCKHWKNNEVITANVFVLICNKSHPTTLIFFHDAVTKKRKQYRQYALTL